jgi:hypothetical protein
VIHLDPFVALRLQRGVEQLHRLGPRATAEFLAEIADEIGGISAIIELLIEYGRRITPDVLRAIGGDHYASQCLDAAPRTGGAR